MAALKKKWNYKEVMKPTQTEIFENTDLLNIFSSKPYKAR